jgi:hypothetical protein
MSGFQNFNRATRGETPRFMDAVIQEKNFENEGRARTDALRNRNETGILETAKYFDKDKALTNYAKDAMGMGGSAPTMSANISEGGADLTADAVSQGFNPMNTGSTVAASPAPISEAVPIGADGLPVASSASGLGGAAGSNALAAEAAAAGLNPMAAATGAGTAAGGMGSAAMAAMPWLAPLALALMA